MKSCLSQKSWLGCSDGLHRWNFRDANPIKWDLQDPVYPKNFGRDFSVGHADRIFGMYVKGRPWGDAHGTGSRLGQAESGCQRDLRNLIYPENLAPNIRFVFFLSRLVSGACLLARYIFAATFEHICCLLACMKIKLLLQTMCGYRECSLCSMMLHACTYVTFMLERRCIRNNVNRSGIIHSQRVVFLKLFGPRSEHSMREKSSFMARSLPDSLFCQTFFFNPADPRGIT